MKGFTGACGQSASGGLSTELGPESALFRACVDTSPDGFWLINASGRLLAVNPAYCRMTGYTEAQLLTFSISDLEAVESPDETSAHVAHLLANGADRFRTRHRRRDGSLFDVEVSVHVVGSGGGLLTALIRDLSAEPGLARALSAEARYWSIFNHSPAAIWEEDFSVVKRSIDALRASGVTDLRTHFARHPEAVLDLASQVRVVAVNPRSVELLGAANAAEVCGDLSRYFTLESLASFGDELASLAEGATSYSAQLPIVRADGQRLQVDLSLTIDADRLDDWSRVVVSFVDVTDRLRAEQELRAQHLRYETMMANTGDVVVVIDGEGMIAYKSPNIERHFGWRPDELVGQPALGLVHPLDQPAAGEFIAALMARPGASGTHECRYRCRDGGYRWIAFTATNLLHDPAIGGLLGNYSDATERRTATQALRDSEAFLRETQEVSHVGSYKFDIPADHWTSSDELDRIFGIGADHPRDAAAWLTLVHPDDRDEMARHLTEEVIGARGTFDHRYRIHRANDGAERWLWGRGELTFDAQGDPQFMVGTIQDITEVQEAEQARLLLSEQLARAQKLESIGRLAGGVAHDFNNMLAVIMGHLELALDQVASGSPLRDDLLTIQEAARRSADLTRQLLAFARQQTVTPKVLDLNQTVEGMMRMLERLIGEDIELVWRPGSALWPVCIDPSQVDQLLANLCVNARDAIDSGGRITIETANRTLDSAYLDAHPEVPPGDYVCLTVQDTGRGMDEATLERLFEPFFTTKGLGQGTGLGLATVYGIVQQNNGAIDVTSRPGQGARLSVCLPRAAAAPVCAADEARDAAEPSGGATILLVEDEAGVLRLATRLLTSQGHTVLAAHGAEEALRLSADHAGRIDLLITDIIMPTMNGAELAAAVAAERPELRCLYISGYPADVIAERGLLADETQFLAKPFTKAALARKVAEVLAG